MSSPKYRPTVYEVAGPALATYGFRPRPDLHSSGIAVFTRELRGYENSVEFLLSNHEPAAKGKRAFRFDLEAPKHGGVPSYSFTDRTWWYYDSQEELEAAVIEAVQVLTEKGIAWLDTYTPGNVPDWGEFVQDIIGAVLNPYGFTYQGEKRPAGPALPDLAWFRRRSEYFGYAAVDLRVPGGVQPVLTRLACPTAPITELKGPVFRYMSSADLPSALRQVAGFFASEVEKWIAQAQ